MTATSLPKELSGPDQSKTIQAVNHINTPVDNKTARLMELVNQAIEEWAAEYNLQNLPRRIVFQQVHDVMHVIEMMMNVQNE